MEKQRALESKSERLPERRIKPVKPRLTEESPNTSTAERSCLNLSPLFSSPYLYQPISASVRNQAFLQMQQDYGNRYVQKMIKTAAPSKLPGGMQAKYKISQPGDKYEQEADKIAGQIVQMGEPANYPASARKEAVQPNPMTARMTPLIQKQAVEEEEEEEVQLQARETTARTPGVSSDLSSGIESLKSGGQPLPEGTRAFMEQRFGYDFGSVRIHTDNKAAETAKNLNARAFTVGRDVVFGAGQYSPTAARGQKLLAHELTHVVQQNQMSERLVHRQVGDARSMSITPEWAADLTDEQLAQQMMLLREYMDFLEPTNPEYESACENFCLLENEQATRDLRGRGLAVSPTSQSLSEFDPISSITSIEEAQADPLWVEKGIFNYFMESLKSPEIILIYEDGNIIRIPIKFVKGNPLGADSGRVIMFRRHQMTGRLVPFAISQADLKKAVPTKAEHEYTQVLEEIVPPRFDPSLTPMIPRIVNEELWRLAAIEMLKVARLQVGGALLRGAIRAGAASGLFTTPRVVAGSITAGANLLDQALSYGSDWNKYNWGSVGFDFVFGMVTQSLVVKLFQRFPAPIFSKAANLKTWLNLIYQQAIFAVYGTLVGLIRSQVGNISPGKAVASQHIEGSLQAVKTGAMDTFLKSAFGLEQFPLGKNDLRIVFISKILDVVIKAAVRQTLDVTPRNEPQKK